MDRMRCFLQWLIVLAPALFIVVAIQVSAITVPFWDHCEMIKVIADYYDGTLQIKDLWRPHNHTRPLTYRSIYLANAILTQWDVRSEYLIHISTILAGFVIQAWALWRVLGKQIDGWFLTWMGLLSLVAFSPAGNNNHWWSMMTQLTLAHALIFLALASICLGVRDWKGNVTAVIACWLATYTLTNGLVAFACCAAVAQLTSDRPLRPSKWTWFWGANLIAVATLYLPGMPVAEGRHPNLGQFVWFVIVYLGAPLRALIQYPYRDCFHQPIKTLPAGITGLIVLGLTAYLFIANREHLRRRSPGAVLGLCCVVFAILSAALTAWGRANFDDAGVSNANASRYTLFGGYLLVGLIFFLASVGPAAWHHPWITRWIAVPRQPIVLRCAYVILVLLATVSYVRSARVYNSARVFNGIVNHAYFSPLGDAEMSGKIFPNREYVLQLKKNLQRLHLGPYREMMQDNTPTSSELARATNAILK